MSAEPLRAPSPEMEQPPATAQEAARPTSLNEALTGVPTPEAPREPESLREKEDRAEREGMTKLDELGKNLNLQAESGKQEFEEKTKSWWDRAKGMFKKKEDATPVKGEQEVLMEIEKADAVFAEFRRKAAEIMVSGDEAGLRMLERSLSQSYEELAPQVAAEGAAESKAMKKALKTGEMPPITETGAKLNYVAKRLMDVRGRLNGGAPAKTEAAPQNAPGAAAEAAPVPQAAVVTAPEKMAVPENKEAPGQRDRAELEKAAAGKPGEKMVDEYLKLRDLKSDTYGRIVGKSFDPLKGEIRLSYEDGSQFRKYATGLILRVLPGGQVEEIKPEPVTQTEAAPAAPAEDTDENPILLTPEMKTPATEGVVSGETEAKPEPSELPQEESVVVSPEAHVSSALEKVTKELDGFDFDEAKESLLLNFRIGADVGKNTVESWKKKRAGASSEADFKRTLSEEYDIPSDEIDAIPAPDLAAQHERMLSVLDRLIEVGESEMKKAAVKTSEQASVASGEIENKTVLQKSRSSSEAPTASGEIVVEGSDVIETAPVAETVPAASAETSPAQEAAPVPVAAAETTPATSEITEAQIVKAKENPLAPESMAAIAEALKDRGKLGDGKFSTPAPFREALEGQGFTFPGDMESEELKKLHAAYKKATKK